jgi:hypothetical protein
MKYYLAALLMLASMSAHAELHKWVDAQGNVHYSDAAPPADAKEQQLNLPTAPAAAPSGAAPDKSIFDRESDLEKALKAKAEADKQAQQKQQEAESRRKNCGIARENLRTLQNAPRIMTYDDQGNQVYMDDAARQRSTDEAQQAVEKYCD